MTIDVEDREGFAAFLLRLRGKGIVAKSLIAAFESTPRRAFVPVQWQDVAWAEGMIPIECGEAIEGADLQATALSALSLEPGHRVLEIGTGSGYTASVMSRLAARVLTVERYRTLTELAHPRFETLGIANVFARQADGSNGLAGEGPFDRIVAWAAFDALPRGFVDQLATGGVMIAPVGPAEGEQIMVKLVKVGSRFEREDVCPVRLQPIQSGLPAVI